MSASISGFWGKLQLNISRLVRQVARLHHKPILLSSGVAPIPAPGCTHITPLVLCSQSEKKKRKKRKETKKNFFYWGWSHRARTMPLPKWKNFEPKKRKAKNETSLPALTHILTRPLTHAHIQGNHTSLCSLQARVSLHSWITLLLNGRKMHCFQSPWISMIFLVNETTSILQHAYLVPTWRDNAQTVLTHLMT